MPAKNGMTDIRRRRMRHALLGLFIGDALAMPAHWFYSIQNLKDTFNGGIKGFNAPPHPHPESFMVGMAYRPDVETAERMGRPYDILHDHIRFYNTTYSTLAIRLDARESEHGNRTPQLEDRYHYHHGLQSGENTLGAHLVRVLIRSVIRCGRYDHQAFLDDFIAYLTTPGRNRDPYCEIYVRRWFENFTRGYPAYNCAELQRHVWSIGSHGGLIRPLVVSLLADSVYQGLGLAVEHQNLTHRTDNGASALGVLTPLLDALIRGADSEEAIAEYASAVRIPNVTGEEMFASYRDHSGPGNIPKDEMWRLHTDLAEIPYDVDQLVAEKSEEEVVRGQFANACYPEHGLPLILYFLQKHHADVTASLLADANAGGDNVHRSMITGLLAGAASEEIPELAQGLIAYNELIDEIDAFVDIAISSKGI